MSSRVIFLTRCSGRKSRLPVIGEPPSCPRRVVCEQYFIGTKGDVRQVQLGE